MNTAILLLALLGDAPAVGEMRKDYDKSADFTSWVCTVGPVWKPEPGSKEGISVALASKPAKGPRRVPQKGDERVFVDFSSSGNTARFQKSRPVVVTIDEARPLNLGEPKLLSESIGGAPYYEDFTLQLPLSTLEAIASGKRVEINVAGITIVPTPDQLQIIGKFAKRLRQGE